MGQAQSNKSSVLSRSYTNHNLQDRVDKAEKQNKIQKWLSNSNSNNNTASSSVKNSALNLAKSVHQKTLKGNGIKEHHFLTSKDRQNSLPSANFSKTLAENLRGSGRSCSTSQYNSINQSAAAVPSRDSTAESCERPSITQKPTTLESTKLISTKTTFNGLNANNMEQNNENTAQHINHKGVPTDLTKLPTGSKILTRSDTLQFFAMAPNASSNFSHISEQTNHRKLSGQVATNKSHLFSMAEEGSNGFNQNGDSNGASQNASRTGLDPSSCTEVSGDMEHPYEENTSSVRVCRNDDLPENKLLPQFLNQSNNNRESKISLGEKTPPRAPMHPAVRNKLNRTTSCHFKNLSGFGMLPPRQSDIEMVQNHMKQVEDQQSGNVPMYQSQGKPSIVKENNDQNKTSSNDTSSSSKFLQNPYDFNSNLLAGSVVKPQSLKSPRAKSPFKLFDQKIIEEDDGEVEVDKKQLVLKDDKTGDKMEVSMTSAATTSDTGYLSNQIQITKSSEQINKQFKANENSAPFTQAQTLNETSPEHQSTESPKLHYLYKELPIVIATDHPAYVKSASEMLQCFSNFVAMRLMHFESNVTVSSKDVLQWMRNIDRVLRLEFFGGRDVFLQIIFPDYRKQDCLNLSLLAQGWQDEPFFNPATIVVLFRICMSSFSTKENQDEEECERAVSRQSLRYNNNITIATSPVTPEIRRQNILNQINARKSQEMAQVNKNPVVGKISHSMSSYGLLENQHVGGKKLANSKFTSLSKQASVSNFGDTFAWDKFFTFLDNSVSEYFCHLMDI